MNDAERGGWGCVPFFSIYFYFIPYLLPKQRGDVFLLGFSQDVI